MRPACTVWPRQTYALPLIAAIVAPCALAAQTPRPAPPRTTSSPPAAPPTSGAAAPAPAASDGVLVDFQDAELRFIISALAEAAKVNVSYGDLPAKRITLRIQQPVPRENVPALLRSIAQSNGLRVTDAGGVLRVDAADAGAGRAGAGEVAAEDSADMRLYVYRLRHARAPKLAGTLQALFGGRQTSQASTASRPTLSQRLRETQIPPFTPGGAVTPGGVAPDTRATSGPPVVPPVPAEAGSLPGRLSGEVQIVPEETTNSILVRAAPADYAIIQQAVQALDLRPLQVVIEVLIAEVRRSSDLQLGVSVKGEDKTQGRTGVSGTATMSAQTTGDFVLQVLHAGSTNITATIATLAARGDVRIVSRPVVFAQNNLEAKILVGSERPFVQVFRSLPTDAAVRDQVVQYRDVGTSLTITPTINPDGYVNLQVSQEVSNATSETQFGAPVISTREASTHVFVRDGQTGVIGGLVDRQQDRSRSGVPVLSRLPLLGALFGTTRNSTINSELFLFLTPHIVATDEDTDRVRDGIDARAEQLRRAVEQRPPVLAPAPRDTGAPPPSAPAPTPTTPPPAR